MKKLIKDLGLPVEKIAACKNGCMLYWKDDVDLEYCKFVGTLGTSPLEDGTHAGRSPRMLSLGTCRLSRVCRGCIVRVNCRAHDVACHTSDGGGVKCHPSDAEAWRHFDLVYPNFTEERVIFGLAFAQIVLHHTGISTHGRKACYFDCHRQFLPEQHLYRRNKKAFTKNHVDNKVARPRLSEDQILDWVADINPAVQILLFLPEGYGTDQKWTK
ncbi:UNVERIFIED_CONTAM: hypothetical protein Slati_0947700 [Sesamum latifolium]|uniref:Uncharacterized protein n=1 Tax=Sesamum latifolium TaxID=2727402 RepID=A0AAW2XPY7_9LAMI